MFWSKEEFRTVIWHTKITCKITQKVVLLVLVLCVRWQNKIKIEKKIVKKRYYLDLLNEGSRRGGLGQGDGFELVCGSLGGVLALLRTMSLDGFGQSHRHHVGRCSSIHPREEAEREEWKEERDEGEAKRVGVFFKRGSWERRVKWWLLRPSNLLLERRGFCDLTAHWALLWRFDRGSLPSLYYGVI